MEWTLATAYQLGVNTGTVLVWYQYYQSNKYKNPRLQEIDLPKARAFFYLVLIFVGFFRLFGDGGLISVSTTSGQKPNERDEICKKKKKIWIIQSVLKRKGIKKYSRYKTNKIYSFSEFSTIHVSMGLWGVFFWWVKLGRWDVPCRCRHAWQVNRREREREWSYVQSTGTIMGFIVLCH